MQHDQAPILIDEPLFTSATQKLILVVLASLILVAGIWFFLSEQASRREDQAHLAFISAKSSTEKRQVADQYSGTQQSALIYLQLANESLDTKPQEALDLYESFLKKYGNHLLKNAAALGKAKALESLQKPQEAMAVYQSIVQTKPADTYVPVALLNLSRLQVAQGQVAAARQSLQDLITRHAEYAAEAKERLKSLPEIKS
ncbi:MAG: tetratricopeptide repeat protein [Verrucomicrobiota bacterium]